MQAALFRCDSAAFGALCEETPVSGVPELVVGVFDEKKEACIVDFANKRLGGAWLSYGMVQEEKMFIERFDLGALAARALVEMPDPAASPGCAALDGQNPGSAPLGRCSDVPAPRVGAVWRAHSQCTRMRRGC